VSDHHANVTWSHPPSTHFDFLFTNSYINWKHSYAENLLSLGLETKLGYTGVSESLYISLFLHIHGEPRI
jgi:hypothetical protein